MGLIDYLRYICGSCSWLLLCDSCRGLHLVFIHVFHFGCWSPDNISLAANPYYFNCSLFFLYSHSVWNPLGS